MLQILLITWLHIFHPFYVSVTEIEYNQKQKVVQVSVRIFFDDFESALKKRYKSNINILKPKVQAEVDQLIAAYINSHLKINADGRLLNLKYIGYEIQEDAAWCYFESGSLAKVQRFNIQNDLLFEQHESQINMIHVIVDGKRKSTKLDNPQRSALISF